MVPVPTGQTVISEAHDLSAEVLTLDLLALTAQMVVQIGVNLDLLVELVCLDFDKTG